MTAETKGSSFNIRPDRIIVTSNYSPEDIDGWDETTKAAIRRRVLLVHMPEQISPNDYAAFADQLGISVTPTKEATTHVSETQTEVCPELEMLADTAMGGLEEEYRDSGSPRFDRPSTPYPSSPEEGEYVERMRIQYMRPRKPVEIIDISQSDGDSMYDTHDDDDENEDTYNV